MYILCIFYGPKRKEKTHRPICIVGAQLKIIPLLRCWLQSVSWSECREVPVQDCKPKEVHIPTQELLHRKKCLLPGSGAESAAAGGLEEPLPTYGDDSPIPVPAGTNPAFGTLQHRPRL